MGGGEGVAGLRGQRGHGRNRRVGGDSGDLGGVRAAVVVLWIGEGNHILGNGNVVIPYENLRPSRELQRT